jgi:hypothetical protein
MAPQAVIRDVAVAKYRDKKCLLYANPISKQALYNRKYGPTDNSSTQDS